MAINDQPTSMRISSTESPKGNALAGRVAPFFMLADPIRVKMPACDWIKVALDYWLLSVRMVDRKPATLNGIWLLPSR